MNRVGIVQGKGTWAGLGGMVVGVGVLGAAVTGGWVRRVRSVIARWGWVMLGECMLGVCRVIALGRWVEMVG